MIHRKRAGLKDAQFPKSLPTPFFHKRRDTSICNSCLSFKEGEYLRK